jgi:hypothetical protein
MESRSPYIIEAFFAVREKHALRQIMRTDVLRELILRQMGLTEFSWVILDFDVQWTHRKPGDVDIIGGPLAWRERECVERAFQELSREYPHWNESLCRQLSTKRAAESEGFTWPPDFEFVSGAEAKCAFFKAGKAYSAKPYDDDVAALRDQVNGLLLLELDRVNLLDVIATEPATGTNLTAWFGAHSMSQAALAAIKDVLAARLPRYSPSGHMALVPGAVIGADESIRGAPLFEILRSGVPAPARVGQSPGRARLNDKLRKVLAKQPNPRYYPAIFVQCVACERVHALYDHSCKFSVKPSRDEISEY